MIDIHAHILPEMDDGPKTLLHAIELVKQAGAQGVTGIIATPHSMDGVYQCTPQDIFETCGQLNAALKSEGVPIHIHPGAEVRLTHDLISLYDSGQLVTLGDNGNFLLLELPSMFIIDGVCHIIRQLAARGVDTIIAHPERNRLLIKRSSLLLQLLQEGAFLQITSSSLTGSFGRSIKKISEAMVKEGLVSFVASDIHPGRRWMLQKAYEKVLGLAGEKQAEIIFRENPERVIGQGSAEAVYVKGTV